MGKSTRERVSPSPGDAGAKRRCDQFCQQRFGSYRIPSQFQGQLLIERLQDPRAPRLVYSLNSLSCHRNCKPTLSDNMSTPIVLLYCTKDSASQEHKVLNLSAAPTRRIWQSTRSNSSIKSSPSWWMSLPLQCMYSRLHRKTWATSQTGNFRLIRQLPSSRTSPSTSISRWTYPPSELNCSSLKTSCLVSRRRSLWRSISARMLVVETM